MLESKLKINLGKLGLSWDEFLLYMEGKNTSIVKDETFYDIELIQGFIVRNIHKLEEIPTSISPPLTKKEVETIEVCLNGLMTEAVPLFSLPTNNATNIYLLFKGNSVSISEAFELGKKFNYIVDTVIKNTK